MKVKDLIEAGEKAIGKFEGTDLDLTDFKETVRRLKLLSPQEQQREIPQQKEKRMRRAFKKLKIDL